MSFYKLCLCCGICKEYITTDYFAFEAVNIFIFAYALCTAYELDGEIIHDFPIGSALDRCKPVYEYLDGFGDINGITDYKDLPENAKKYIDFIEKSIGVPIQYISTGAERDSYIRMF